MQLEDRLDALLTLRLDGSSRPSGASAGTGADDELMPLLQAADMLAPLRTARPSAEFARSLEVRLLASVASHATDAGMLARVNDTAGHQPGGEFPWAASTEPSMPRRMRPRRTLGTRPLWQMVAAAVLLLVAGVSALTAAAAAGPGSPLFGLHRAEQNVRVQFASSQSDRVRLHLSYADEALSQLDRAVTQQAGDPAYRAALTTFLTEQRAAAQGVAALPAGAERDALSAQLSALRAKAQSDLRAALHAISWSDRLATTQALGELGEIVPIVNDVNVTREDGQNVHIVRLVVQGSGFAAGATVTVGGQAVGTLLSSSATQLVVESDATTLHLPVRDVGVSNPDGTAALSPRIEMDNGAGNGGSENGHPTPGAQPTATPKDGHGRGGGG